MSFLFNGFVYQPLYNLLIFIYNIIPFHDFGIAIIIVTILLKVVLIPLSRKQIESQKKMQEMQPKIKEIQKKYAQDKEKQSRALMDFYKKNKTNPFSGCLPVIFQLIFLIAIYRVLFNISGNGLVVDGSELYFFVTNPEQINQFFLGIIDLSNIIDLKNITASSIPQFLLVLAAAGAQYFQMKMLMPKQEVLKKESKDSAPDMAQMMSKQMMYIGPLLTLFIGIRFAAGLSLYWFVSTVFAIVQQKYIIKRDYEKEEKFEK